MSGPEIRWCSQSGDEFLVVNQDLTLHKVEKRSPGEKASSTGISVPISVASSASIVGRTPVSVPIKCWDWHNERKLVAVGESSGKVTLLSPYPELGDPYVGREFAPRHSRICRDIRWCPTKSFDHILAAAYEKYHRSDPAVLIWDPLHGPVGSAQDSDQSALTRKLNRQLHSEQGGSGQIRPIQELAGGESGYSLAWFPQNRTLAAGLSNKYIKIYDTRGDYSSGAPQTIFTRAVLGLRVNPLDERKLLSYHDNYLFVWDLRSLKQEKPLVGVTAPHPHKILQAEWDGTRGNVLSCLYTASPFVKLFHLQKMSGDEREVSFVERHVLPRFLHTSSAQSRNILSGFSWHPAREGEMLAVSLTGLLSSTTLTERLCLNWNSNQRLLATFGRTMAESQTFVDSRMRADISHQMYWRASVGYGLNLESSSLKQNVEILENERHSRLPPRVREMLSWTWIWMERIKNLSGESDHDWNYHFRYCGVRAVWETKRQGEFDSSQRLEIPIAGLESQGTDTYHQIYVSGQRNRILRLCGWGVVSGEGPGIETCLRELTSGPSPSYTRAAAIAMFCLRLQHAVELLIKAADAQPRMEHLQLVAMALAGYKGASEGGQASIWQRLCSSILPKVQDPYLRAIFLFLSGRLEPDTKYGALMRMEELPLYDRVAFAAIHFADHPLEEVYFSLAKEAVRAGDLFGLLLTGITNQEDSMDLFQNYVDKTGDVQSASLLLIHSGWIPWRGRVQASLSSHGSSRLPVVEEVGDVPGWHLVESYLSLLNTWQLWHTRAHTEALINQKQASESAAKLRSQISIICTFCNRMIFNTGGRQRGRGTKSGACPNHNCKKPLPRCVLCRRHMGTPLPKEQERSELGKQKKFESWFTWCQSCRHGGHAIHMKEWFKDNSECPVTGCPCKCAQLDTKEVSQ